MTTATRTLPAPTGAITTSSLQGALTPRERLERGGGWWTLFLTLVMVLSMAISVHEAAWSDGLGAVEAAALAGVLLSFCLALTRWQGLFPAAYGFLASLAFVAIFVLQAMLPKLSLHDGLQELIQRNVAWVAALFTGRPNADNLIFVTQLSFLAWWIGYFAMWSLIRHQRVIHAILPAGIGLLVNTWFAPVSLTGYVLVYLLAVLMLAIRIELTRNELRWQSSRIRYAPDLYLDFLRSGFIFAVAVIALAWITPGVANETVMERLGRPFEEPWKRIERTWQRMYKSLNYDAAPVQVSTYGRSTTFGGPVNLTDRPIFVGETPERTYWRAAAFDQYTSSGWENTDADVLIIERNQPLPEPTFSATRQITVTIRSLEVRQDVIFGPPQVARVSLTANADATRLPEEKATTERRQAIVSLLRSRVSFARDSTYQVVANVSDAAPDLLRKDHTNYPAWVTSRYLQLPESLPARVRAMARRIVSTYTNPFDQASAIENELRKLTYNQNIAAPPAGADGVDYFLFSAKQGYCDYYASALVVMLRSVGIPARFVTGYTPGQLQDLKDIDLNAPYNFRVLEQNSHAWVEVFFPTYGWIQFEPTASEVQLSRPQSRESSSAAAARSGGPDEFRDPFDDPLMRGPFGNLGSTHRDPAVVRWLRANWVRLVVVVILAAAAAAVLSLIRRQRRVLFAAADLAGRLFGLLELWARRLRITWPTSHTPLEHAAAFGTAVPDAGPPVNRLAVMFAAQRYGRQEPDQGLLRSTAEDWRFLEPIFWKSWGKQIVDAVVIRVRR